MWGVGWGGGIKQEMVTLKKKKSLPGPSAARPPNISSACESETPGGGRWRETECSTMKIHKLPR